MFFVYFLQSIQNPQHTYIGFTTNINERLNAHNLGESLHTAKYKPWKMITYVAFDRESKARNFEKYVKVGSGNAWAKKRFW